MKKFVALSLTALTVFPAFAGSATAAKKPKQAVEGTILLNQSGAAAGPCVYRTQRTLWAVAGQPNGIFGYTFEVDPKTAGKKFVLEVSDGAGMDISFYADLGNPAETTAPANMGYETPGPGGEDGIVPKGFPYAFVCLNEGVNASFTYTAG